MGEEECAPFTKKYERGLEKIEDDVRSSSSSEDIELCAVGGGQGGFAAYGTKQGSAGLSSSVARLGQERDLPADAFGQKSLRGFDGGEHLEVIIYDMYVIKYYESFHPHSTRVIAT